MEKISYKNNFSDLTEKQKEEILKLGDAFCEYHNNLPGPNVDISAHRGYLRENIENLKKNYHLMVMYFKNKPISFCIYCNDGKQRKN